MGRTTLLSLLFLVVGVTIGIWVGHVFLWRGSPTPLGAPSPPAATAEMAQPAPLTACEATISFNNNLYPSLMLSLGTAYPDYIRCLSLTVSHAPLGGTCKVRVESNLFEQPMEHMETVSSDRLELTPDLPWNYALLRGVTQLRPELFLISVSIDNRQVAQTTVTCMVHPVNEAVSRVFDGATNEWQDTSVCFAGFVNEDDPWINSFMQEVLARGAIQRFAGYEFGAQSVVQQMQAIWDGLAAKGLHYVDLATTPGGVPDVNTQYVRFLRDSLRDQGANCVDASVLFASIFRRIGLHPVLLLRPGHCFVAVFDAAEGGKLIGVETTMLSSSTFAAAMTYGDQELQANLSNLNSPGYSSVDIALARQQGVMPIEEAY